MKNIFKRKKKISFDEDNNRLRECIMHLLQEVKWKMAVSKKWKGKER